MWDTEELLAFAAARPRLRFLYHGGRDDGRLIPRHGNLGLLQVDVGLRGWKEAARFRYSVPGVRRQVARARAWNLIPYVALSDLGAWTIVDAWDDPKIGSDLGLALMADRLESS